MLNLAAGCVAVAAILIVVRWVRYAFREPRPWKLRHRDPWANHMDGRLVEHETDPAKFDRDRGLL